MKLLINADDYGLTMNVSKGILHGLKEGCLTETSAIVSCDDFPEAAKMAIENGIYEMGLHCLLTVNRPIIDPHYVPSLVDENGKFYSRKEFMNKEISIKEAEMELEAQIQLLLSTGLKLNHIDTHHGFMLKSREMFDLFVKLAKKYDVPLRNEISHELPEDHDEYIRKLEENNIRMVDLTYFNHGTPCHTIEDVMTFLKDAMNRYETVEIGCHPGYSDEQLRKISILNDDRENDLSVMTSKELKDFIRENRIELIGYESL
ncbi:MAG: ChbG/HpnK family deacetylase [Erysipelotrichaceae bacterium]|nr:ChbG/HpnK family deacetylase [Erysipelotrichaceae bacterium]MBR3264934.1 ChbG/HpnK family deacetylase [Erysipelotrichaceae bacterium]